MIALLLILIPLLGGIITFFIKPEPGARTWSLLTSIATFVVAIIGFTLCDTSALQYQAPWMGILNSSFSIAADGMGAMLCMLTSISFPIIFVSTWNTPYSNAKNFLGLMLLAQAGLIGVFLAMDALLFYFFWELALIPVYFICSQWGNEKRIKTTFKFFVYTFFGSLLMLVGILYIYAKTGSFDITAFYNSQLSPKEQMWAFWLFFLAFAIKMPVFPFHSWQPDTYEQSPTAGTMVLSAIMAKMGVLGLLRWLLPVLPVASFAWGDTISTMAIIGIIYASIIAFRQDDMKRLVAYSSIAHIGLMCLAVFAENRSAFQGVMFQMFAHGINVLGMWVVVEIIERKFGTRKMSELGGIAKKAPVLTIFFFTIAFASIALPLTNAFVGEFLMLNGVLGVNPQISKYGFVMAISAGLGIIFSAVYILRMGRKVFLGETNALTEKGTDIAFHEKAILGIIVATILVSGVYPQHLLHSFEDITNFILHKSDVLPLLNQKH